MQLREDQHRRQRIDAAETAQPPDRLPIRLGLRDLRQPGIQLHEPGVGVIDRQQVIVDDGAPPHASTSDCRSTGGARASNSDPRSAARAAAATCLSGADTAADLPARHPAHGRGPARPRTRGVGGCTAVSNPARPSSTSFRASRRFVFTRSPGFRGISAGATTSQLTRDVVTCRCNA